jgi:hypothetical protein
MQEQIKEMELQ